VYVDKNNNPYLAVKDGMEKFKDYDTIIIDTAGRDALDKELAEELKKLAGIVKPDEVLLTIPADIGKIAGPQSSEFDKLVGITGVIITRMDGSAKGGGALTSCHATHAKVKFIGTGEKIENFEVYEPERFVSRLLGLGDLQTLLEKAKEAEIKKEKVEEIIEGKLTLQDFYEQLKAMQKMGPLKQIMSLIPGFGMVKLPEELLEVQEAKLKKFAVIIQSMTKKEKEEPGIIGASGVKRIAKGSGTSEAEVRQLLAQYNQMKKLLRTMGGVKGLQRGRLKELAKSLGLRF
jgi:signal recognition particle subunit SRP54